VNEEDSERDRATPVYKKSSAVRRRGRMKVYSGAYAVNEEDPEREEEEEEEEKEEEEDKGLFKANAVN